LLSDSEYRFESIKARNLKCATKTRIFMIPVPVYVCLTAATQIPKPISLPDVAEQPKRTVTLGLLSHSFEELIGKF